MHKKRIGLGSLIVFGTVAAFSLLGLATMKDKLNSIDAASTQKINNEELENQIEAFLLTKIKDSKLVIEKQNGNKSEIEIDTDIKNTKPTSNLKSGKAYSGKLSSEILIEADSEIVGLKCYSIRQFLKNEGIKVAKIYNSNIAEYLGQLNKHFSNQLQAVITKDLKNQIGMAKNTHRAPRICFADIKDASDGRSMIFVSPNILLTPKSTTLKAIDFGYNEEQLEKEKQKEQGTKTGSEDNL